MVEQPTYPRSIPQSSPNKKNAQTINCWLFLCTFQRYVEKILRNIGSQCSQTFLFSPTTCNCRFVQKSGNWANRGFFWRQNFWFLQNHQSPSKFVKTMSIPKDLGPKQWNNMEKTKIFQQCFHHHNSCLTFIGYMTIWRLMPGVINVKNHELAGRSKLLDAVFSEAASLVILIHHRLICWVEFVVVCFFVSTCQTKTLSCDIAEFRYVFLLTFSQYNRSISKNITNSKIIVLILLH